MIKWEEYPPLAADSPVVIYTKKQQLSAKYEELGRVELVCNAGLSKIKSCDSAYIFDAAKTKARETGGNALLITRHKKPSVWNSVYFLDANYSLNANILKIFHPDSLHTVKKPEISKIQQGAWDLRLSLPYMNFFQLKPDKKKTILNAGFMGISLGVDYYHKRNQYLSIFAASVTDFSFPIKFVSAYGEREECISRFIGLTNNYRYKSLTFGYGLSYSHNSWKYFSGDRDNDFDNYADIPPDKKYTGNMLGLMFTAYWLSKNNFFIGFIYRPDFICLNSTSPFKYEHLISIDFGWRIRLKTAK